MAHCVTDLSVKTANKARDAPSAAEFLQPSVYWELEWVHQQATNSRQTETTSSFQWDCAKLAVSEVIACIKKLMPFMPMAE